MVSCHHILWQWNETTDGDFLRAETALHMAEPNDTNYGHGPIWYQPDATFCLRLFLLRAKKIMLGFL